MKHLACLAVVMVVVAGCRHRASLPRAGGSLNLAPETGIRIQPPMLSAALERFRAPRIERVVFSSGLEVMVVERPNLPIASIAIGVRAGQLHESANEAGVSCLMADLLNQGSKLDDGQQLRKLNVRGILPEVSCTADGVLISFDGLAIDLPAALTMLSAVIRHPVFVKSQVESGISLQLERRFANSTMLGTHLIRSAYAELYGDDNPLGRDPTFVRDTLREQTPESMRVFHANHYQPSKVLIAIVGAVKKKQVAALVENHLGSWPDDVPVTQMPGASFEPVTTPVSTAFLGCAEHVRFILAIPAVGHDDSDYWPLRLLMTLLGQQHASPLNRELRYHEGVTYGIRAEYIARSGSGELVFAGDISSESLPGSLEFLQNEFVRFGREPLSGGELGAAQQVLLGELADLTNANDELAWQLARSSLLQQEVDFLDDVETRVSAVGVEDVRRAASRYLKATRGALALCATRGTVDSALKGFGAVKWFELL